MNVLYIKALHIIFVVTWFAGMFYFVRLLIYHREAADRPAVERDVLLPQLALMMKRLLFGITLPSAILTAIFGIWMLYFYGYLSGAYWPVWLWIKLGMVLGLYAYHYSMHWLYGRQIRGVYPFSSQQLRLWNELATIFLVAIVFLVVVRSGLSLVYGLGGLAGLMLILFGAIYLYKKYRSA